MYRANHYVRVNGKTYTRDEIIPIELSAEQETWLLEAGAIRKVQVAPAALDNTPANSESEESEEERELRMTRENYADQLGMMGYDPSGNPIGKDDESNDEQAEGEQVEDEADDEAEAPEIDAMDGVVQDAPDEEKPVKTTAKRGGGRRKTK